MKAKMPPSQKPPESGDYQCLECDTIFHYETREGGKLECPTCGDSDRKDLVPIYMENYAPEDKMYTSSDWHGGA